MKCLRCGLINPETALRCKCGPQRVFVQVLLEDCSGRSGGVCEIVSYSICSRHRSSIEFRQNRAQDVSASLPSRPNRSLAGESPSQ